MFQFEESFVVHALALLVGHHQLRVTYKLDHIQVILKLLETFIV